MNNPEDPKLQTPSLFKMITSFAKELTDVNNLNDSNLG